MRVARVRAQAKINQTLHVLERNEQTGYHEIVTQFQRIDLADDIVVHADVVGRTLDVDGPRVPAAGLGPVERNLAYRAAVEFSDRTGWPDGFEIRLTKNIPVGGGLGGGSADAGGVLRALNALAPRPLGEDKLLSVAKTLGSDVPFLTKDWVSAIGLGRGTELKNLSMETVLADLPPDIRSQLPPGLGVAPPFILVVVPGISISTLDAYRWLDEDRSEWGDKVPPLRTIALIDTDRLDTMSHEELLRWRDEQEAQTMINDFEPAIEARFPELRRFRERLLEKGAFRARLAGSGSCVFGLFHHTPPSDAELGLDADVIRTRLSTHVVQVEVLE